MNRLARVSAMTVAMAFALTLTACGDKESEGEDAAVQGETTATETGSTEAAATGAGDVGAIDGTVASGDKPVILVVGRQQIFGSSKAGADMRDKLQAIRTAIESDQEKEMEALIKDAQKLQQQRAILSQEQFQQKQVELGRREEFIKFKFSKELEAAQENAQSEVMTSLYPILQDLMKEKSGTLLMDQSSVLMVSASYNITGAAIERLDAVKPTVDVVRISYEDLVKAAQAQVEERKKAQEAAQQ